MDLHAPLGDEANDYVSDSNSESSKSDYELQSNEESESLPQTKSQDKRITHSQNLELIWGNNSIGSFMWYMQI